MKVSEIIQRSSWGIFIMIMSPLVSVGFVMIGVMVGLVFSIPFEFVDLYLGLVDKYSMLVMKVLMVIGMAIGFPVGFYWDEIYEGE